MQSLDRLLRVIETVAANTHGSSAAEVAESAGLSLSTVSRLMHELADEDVLTRSERDRRYTLGPRLFALARAATHVDLATTARPFLERLRDLTEETASLHVKRGHQRVCLAAAPSRHPVHRVVPPGLTADLGGSATGAVLLSGSSDDEQREQIDALHLPTAERAAFQARINHARASGWALVVDDWVPGLTGLSAAVPGADTTLAALSVSGPSARFAHDTALSHLDDILHAAHSISARIIGEQSNGPPPDHATPVAQT